MYALVLFDLFPRKVDELEWLKLLENYEQEGTQAQGGKKILESAWLIDLSESLSFLRYILDKAQENRLSYKVSFFENEPKFTT